MHGRAGSFITLTQGGPRRALAIGKKRDQHDRLTARTRYPMLPAAKPRTLAAP